MILFNKYKRTVQSLIFRILTILHIFFGFVVEVLTCIIIIFIIKHIYIQIKKIPFC